MQSRAQAMQALFDLLADEPVIVCNGFPSREAQKIRDRPGTFYMIGSMGVAATDLTPQGTVQVAGEPWSAASASGESIRAGESVIVLDIDGLTVRVERAPEDLA